MPNILNFSKILLSHLINHFLKTIFFLSLILTFANGARRNDQLGLYNQVVGTNVSMNS